MTTQCEFILPGQAGTAWLTMMEAIPNEGDLVVTKEGTFRVSAREWYLGAMQRDSIYRSTDHVQIVLRHA